MYTSVTEFIQVCDNNNIDLHYTTREVLHGVYLNLTYYVVKCLGISKYPTTRIGV